VTFNVAESEPLAAGVNVTLIVQPVPAESELPQFELGGSVKSDAFLPITEPLTLVTNWPADLKQ